MSKIKSAWEIALERTESIEVDRSRFARKENTDAARALAGKYLNYDEEITVEKLASQWDKIKDLDGAREGMKATIMQNLTLPGETVLNDRYERLETLLSLITADAQARELMAQIVGFVKQYPEHQKTLFEQLKQRFEPMLQQKAEQMRQQYGQSVPLSLENDQEFLKIAQQQLDALRKQYEENLASAKAQLEAML